MRLKKLELFGFKSFADKTLVVFDQGVTCIVGPNGCGKSNISDSIRWVLGERSPKVLRGSKMEDVIFNGTDFRKPIGYAEVSLTLDNTDKTLPIEYTEVTITRRLHRSGESEYLINKTPCRLKDIYDLILDTGLGSSSYSMIEQGKIDYILNADPDERRFLIEEAAGISKYEAKKDEAVRKLERTEENRTRLNDILHEVQKNIQYAERQAKRAQKYKEHFEKLKGLELRKAFYDIDNIQKESARLTDEENTRRAELETLAQSLAACKADETQLGEAHKNILSRQSHDESLRHHIQSRIDQNLQTLSFHQEKFVEMASRRGQLEHETAQLRDRLEKSALERSERESEIQALLASRENDTQQLASLQQELQSKEARLRESRMRLDEIKSETFKRAMEITQIRNDYHRLSAFLDTSEEQTRKQSHSATRLVHELEEWRRRDATLAHDVEQASQRLTDLSRQKFENRAELDQLATRIENGRSAIQKLEREIHESETQLKIFQDVEAQAEISDRSFLSEGVSSENGELARSLREICEVEPSYAWALEAALDSYARSLVTDKFENATQLLAKFLEKKPVEMGLIVRDIFPDSQDPSAVSETLQHPAIDRSLSEVIRIRNDYQTIFKSFIHQVYITRDNITAESMLELLRLAPQAKFVVPNGTILGPAGKILYRCHDPLQESSLFQRASEIRRLSDQLETLRSTHEQTLTETDALEQSFEMLQTSLEEVESQLLESTIQKESLESHRQGVHDRIQSLGKEEEILKYEAEELQLQLQENLTQKEKLELQLKVAEEEDRQRREVEDGVFKGIEAEESERAALNSSITESRIRLKHLEDRLGLIRNGLAMLEEHRHHDEARIESIAREQDEMVQKEADLNRKDEEIRQQQNGLDEERRGVEVNLELIRREKEETEARLSEVRAAGEELQRKAHALEQGIHEFAIKRVDLTYQEKNIQDRLVQVYRLQLSEFKAEDYPMQEDPAEMEAELQTLREKVENIGTVNLLAIEEYDELKQRFDFLQTQMKDLEEARTALLETIRQINRTTKSLFEQTFVEVQKNFQEYYELLFRGGSAKLVLTDEANPLESGIDIMVRPPGKKLQHISLLSGGEKALTAIALLFALYKIKPSPFCVLDEVDAPLDEANVDRFIGVLKSFLQLSQFIIVTHNRKTIAMGNSLYGVTMQEAGVSKIVSVKVSDDNLEASKKPVVEDSKSVEEQLQN